MSTQSPLPQNDPMLIAFQKLKKTPEYQNAVKWTVKAENESQADGELWFGFAAGYAAAREIEIFQSYCDCGICQYCNGDEDKYGNPTDKSVIEIGSIRRNIKMLVVIECSECDEAKTDAIPLNGDLLSFRLKFSKTVWKYGWIVESDKVLCPNCRADEEEWRSI